MMELTTCAFILIFISLVTATPYGYGVKGGAGASGSAVSSAIAGSFENSVPLAVPLGSAFSGSFSKSSSSSSSSSSASSSSSSSSFSYNGSGGAIFSSPETNGNTGCTSGICQNTGHKGPISSSANFNGYNIANSAAVAGSGGTTGVSCQGSQCNGSGRKCSSGQCRPTEASITGYDSGNKCSPGQCSPNSPSGHSASQFDNSEDIHFVPHSSKVDHDSKNHSFDDKTTGYTASSDCRHGNCGPSGISTQPTLAHDSSNSYPPNSYSGVTPGSNLPATHLETPNPNSSCNSGTCQIGHDNSPTSYNVPIHGSPSGCNTPGCSRDFSSPGANLPMQYDRKKDASEKKLPIYTGGFGGPAGMLKPNEFNIPIYTTSRSVPFANPTHNIPSIPAPGCTTPNCIGSPTTTLSGTSTTDQSGSYSGSITESNNKPIYTGGFGGPAGMVKPNEFNIPISTTSRPVPFANPTHNMPSIPVPGCTTPNCFGSPTTTLSSTSTTDQSGSYSGSITESNNKPIYTGGFGGPAGMLKPNEFNIPISTTSKPVPFANPTHNMPSMPVAGCTTPNCIGSHTIAVSGTSTTAQPGSYSGSIITSNNKPIYTGGFGGPPGMLKPDEFDIKLPVHSSTPSYNNHSPTLPAGCTTPNCNAAKPILESSSKHPIYTGGFGGPPGVLNPNVANLPYSTPNTHTFSAGDTTPPTSFGVPKPITEPNPSFSGSTNNYRPIGVTYPGAPAVAPITSSYDITQPSTGISSPECKTRNCATYPSGVPVVTGPSGSYENSDACKGGNCDSHPVTSFNINASPENHGNSAICKTGNCAGLPTGGTDDKSVADTNTSSGLYGYSTECKTGNCGVSNAVSSRPHDITYPSNSLKPSIPQYAGASPDTVVPSGSGSMKCKTLNCADTLTTNSGVNEQTGYDVKSKEQLPVYTGGFGGPPGLLKPNDYSKPYVTATPDKPLPGLSNPATCSSGICKPKEVLAPSGGHSFSLNGAHATAASSSNAVAYSGGFGGPPGFLTPYDNGKVDLTKVTNGQKYGTHYNGANALDTDVTVPTGTQSNTVSLSGSVVGTTAVSGATASANSGSFGYHSQDNQNGGSPCGGGCGGGHENGSQNSGSYSAAAARSLSGSGAHGVGGSFASSAASAQSSAGAYTKGGYGKR